MQDGTITLEFADGDYAFRLALGQLRELQEKCSVVCPLTKVVLATGFPPAILARIEQNQWAVNDIREVMRLGLIGGGLEPVPAKQLVERYVDGNLKGHAHLALLVLTSSIVGGFADETGEVAEQKNEKKEGAASAPPGSPLQTSTDQPLNLDTAQTT